MKSSALHGSGWKKRALISSKTLTLCNGLPTHTRVSLEIDIVSNLRLRNGTPRSYNMQAHTDAFISATCRERGTLEEPAQRLN